MSDETFPVDPAGSGDATANPVSFSMADLLANMMSADMALLAAALKARTKSPLEDNVEDEDEEDDPSYSLHLFNGLNLSASRTDAQLINNKVRVSRNNRGTDPDQKVKTFTRWCGYSLTHKLKQPDFSKLFSSSSDDDIGTAALSSQTAFDGAVDWFRQVDAHYLLQMPDCDDLLDYQKLQRCSTSKDLTNVEVCRDTEFDSVCQYMELINRDGSAVDVETSEWIQVKLEKSIDTMLLQQVKQSLLELPIERRGGVVLWKLIVDAIESRGFEYIQALQNFITSFDIRTIDGENVPVGTTRFKAAVSGLGSNVPTNAVYCYLLGMSKASNEEFKLLCNSQIGFIQSAWYKKLYRDVSILSQLSEVGSTLGDKYLALKTSNQWSGVNNLGSAFASALLARSHRYATYEDWWDHQVCEICGKPHPTKYHDNLGARTNKDLCNARTKARTVTNVSKPAVQQSPRRRFRFKSNSDKQKFKAAVHQAMMENCDAASDSDGETFHANISEMPSDTVAPFESSSPLYATCSQLCHALCS
ncbi:hypothetical protein ACHAWO_001361 [Cyclotella atomus]|uniref:Uncharacterized protein n=1 Tax=Cyclotella atomus TaxID=382360 RepID=A0ABD3QNS0_9STRA